MGSVLSKSVPDIHFVVFALFYGYICAHYAQNRGYIVETVLRSVCHLVHSSVSHREHCQTQEHTIVCGSVVGWDLQANTNKGILFTVGVAYLQYSVHCPTDNP